MILGLIVLLNHIYRTLFFDLMILMVFYVHVMDDIITSAQLKLLAFLLIASWGMDLWWIIDFSTPWWSGTSKSLTDDSQEVTIKKYTVFMTFIQFLYKIVVALAFMYLAYEFKKAEESNPRNSESKM